MDWMLILIYLGMGKGEGLCGSKHRWEFILKKNV